MPQPVDPREQRQAMPDPLSDSIVDMRAHEAAARQADEATPTAARSASSAKDPCSAWRGAPVELRRPGWPHQAPFRRRSARTFAGFRSPETSSLTRPRRARQRHIC